MSVSPYDLETSLGRTLTPGELAQVEVWISDALLLIEARLGNLSALDQARLDYVVREAVSERLRNPLGIQEESESIDDYSRSWKMAASVKRVTIWPEWWDLLAPKRRRAFSVMPS